MQIPPYTAFDGHHRILSGSLFKVALAVKQAIEKGAQGPVLTFDNSKGRVIDIDIRGPDEAVLARLEKIDGANPLNDHFACNSAQLETQASRPRTRGRPKLGVVAREVTLLPRHWEWLASQPGGASVAMRKLIDEARQTHGQKDKQRQAQERTYQFMSAIAGDMPGFEEATRALFANDEPRFRNQIFAWPSDIREHAIELAFKNE